jgi:hypothetical protein
MILTPQELAREAAATGFPAEALERVFRLMGLLEALSSHPFLKTRLALKGGTALNLFLFDVPRLSVDIDFNYIGSGDREILLAERPKGEQAVQAVASREGFTIKRMPSEHAGGKWRLGYVSSTGDSGNLELDVNFILRTPLWPPVLLRSHPVGSHRTAPVRVLDAHELAAGKLAALVARGAGRDIFDAHRLLATPNLDRPKLRLGFVVYGGINRKDWRTVSPDDLEGDPAAMLRDLVPMLRSDLAPPRRDVATWAANLVMECRERLSAVLPLSQREREFIQRLNDAGEINAELLTGDEAQQATIRQHPGLKWKALNVKRHLGLASEDAT